jgi:uncharacterized protein involved in exopolysaccharide biosynthesis
LRTAFLKSRFLLAVGKFPKHARENADPRRIAHTTESAHHGENLHSTTMETPASMHHGVHNYLAMIWRHKGKLLLILLLGLTLTLTYVALVPRKYQSDAEMYVQLGRESASLDPTATTAGQIVGVADTRESEVLAVKQLLCGRLLAEQVVDRFGPEKILEKDPKKPGLQLAKRLSFLDGYNLNPLRVYSLRDKAIEAFQENLKVDVVRKTSVVSAHYEAEDPQLAHDVLACMLNQACDEHLRVHRTKGSQQFFAEQTALLKSNLATLEEQYRDLKDKTGLASLESQRDIELKLAGALDAELKKACADRDGVRAELEQRREKLKHQAEFVVSERMTGQPMSTGQSLREKIFDLEVQEQELAAKFTDTNPLLMQLRTQLAEARKIVLSEKLPGQVTSSVSDTFKATRLAVQEREAQLVTLDARIEALEAQIAEVESILTKINESEVALKRLEREIDLTRANYTRYSENLEQARINHELEEAKITSLTLMQPPTYSQTPVSPRPLIALAMGFVLSAICGLGVIFLAEGWRRTPVRRTFTEESVASENGDATAAVRRGEFVPANPR